MMEQEENGVPMTYDEFWQHEYGSADVGRDYTGRILLRSRFARYGHRFGWVIERIFRDGGDFASNLHIVHVDTETERAGRARFLCGGRHYAVVKTPHTAVPYDYSRKDFSIVSLDAQDDLWRLEFGESDCGVDFAGETVLRNRYGEAGAGGWNVDHIRPLARGGADAPENMQIASVRVNSVKADRTEFSVDGVHYAVKRSAATTEDEWRSTPYDYARKDWCVVRTGGNRS